MVILTVCIHNYYKLRNIMLFEQKKGPRSRYFVSPTLAHVLFLMPETMLDRLQQL